MNYRDTAIALARTLPDNFVGVWFSVPTGTMPARWFTVSLASESALRDWYAEIAGAPTLYYYVAVFDKMRGTGPVVEVVAPPKPGDPGWSGGYVFRPPPFPSRETVSGDIDRSEVTRGLYVGSRPAPGRHPGIDMIVLAAQEYQPPADLFPGAEVIHAPLDDAPHRLMRPDEIETAVRTAARVTKALREGRSVLVTCQMGLNRSALIAALAMQATYGMSAEDIIDRLRRSRGLFALSNPNFERLLHTVIDVRRAS